MNEPGVTDGGPAGARLAASGLHVAAAAARPAPARPTAPVTTASRAVVVVVRMAVSAGRGAAAAGGGGVERGRASGDGGGEGGGQPIERRAGVARTAAKGRLDGSWVFAAVVERRDLRMPRVPRLRAPAHGGPRRGRRAAGRR